MIKKISKFIYIIMTTYIYKLFCNNFEIKPSYIGSTKNLKKRMLYHRYAIECKTDEKYNRNMYKFIRLHGGYHNWSFKIIDAFECDDKVLVNCLERHYIINNEHSLNERIPISDKRMKKVNKLVPLMYKIIFMINDISGQHQDNIVPEDL